MAKWLKKPKWQKKAEKARRKLQKRLFEDADAMDLQMRLLGVTPRDHNGRMKTADEMLSAIGATLSWPLHFTTRVLEGDPFEISIH